jgi:hypothetical protein
MIFGFFWAKPANGSDKLAANASQKASFSLVIAAGATNVNERQLVFIVVRWCSLS